MTPPAVQSPPNDAMLRDLPFLRDIPADVLAPILPTITEVRFAAGEPILVTGQYVDAAFIVAEGEVEMRMGAAAAPPLVRTVARPKGWFGRKQSAAVQVPVAPLLGQLDPAGGTDTPGFEVSRLGVGDMFAETSALSRYPSTADVTATVATRCWRIGAPALGVLLDLPECARLLETFDTRYRERSLAAVLRRIGPFKSASSQAMKAARDRAQLKSYKRERVIVEQGTPVDGLLIIRAGYVKVVVQSEGSSLVATYLRPGDVAGELARVIDEPWPFSLVALENVDVVKLPAATIDELCREFPELTGELAVRAAARLKERGRALREPERAVALDKAMVAGLVNGSSVLLIDLTTCTRCDNCVQACSDTHRGVPRFIREGARFGRFSVPSACFHCADPVCMVGCPTGAISRPFGTQEVMVNEQTCIGCGNCSQRCPWGNIHPTPFNSPTLGTTINLAVKCDLCAGRADGPACVQMCPHGAAIRIDGKDADELNRLLVEAQ